MSLTESGASLADLFLLIAALGLAGLSLLNRLWVNQSLTVFLRWVRWAFVSYFLSHLSISWGQSERPWFILWIIWAGVWFLLESIYHWVAIKALGFSDVNLFPRFKLSSKEGYWPVSRQSKQIKNWLKINLWHKQLHAEAKIMDEVNLDCHVFLSEDRQHLLQILWIPGKGQQPTPFYSFQCRSAEGTLWVCDNIAVPYGGYYPDYWNSLRKPLISSISGLWRIHQKNMSSVEIPLMTYGDDSLALINKQQRSLAQYNWEQGFTVTPAQQEEEGKITEEGRYRIWKEMWLIRYLGVTL